MNLNDEQVAQTVRAVLKTTAAVIAHVDNLEPKQRTTENMVLSLDVLRSTTSEFLEDEQKALFDNLLRMLLADIGTASENAQLLRRPQ